MNFFKPKASGASASQKYDAAYYIAKYNIKFESFEYFLIRKYEKLSNEADIFAKELNFQLGNDGEMPIDELMYSAADMVTAALTVSAASNSKLISNISPQWSDAEKLVVFMFGCIIVLKIYSRLENKGYLCKDKMNGYANIVKMMFVPFEDRVSPDEKMAILKKGAAEMKNLFKHEKMIEFANGVNALADLYILEKSLPSITYSDEYVQATLGKMMNSFLSCIE